MYALREKTAVVTGGAAGIGLETCRRLVKAGCVVTLWDVNAAGLARARKELSRGGARVFAYRCDVTKRARVSQLARRAVKDMGRVDILVNNAGILVPGGFLDQAVEKWEKTVDVNFVALLHTIRAFLPDMHARNEGRIVNVSSAAGLLGVPGIAVYGATKWAVFGLTEALRHESWNAGKRGVMWASIHPMYVKEGIFAGARLPGLGGLISPRSAAMTRWQRRSWSTP
jgi:all-trans-retinol dehydrogenase (NAD+)